MKVIAVVIKQYPVLIPTLIKVNCNKIITKHLKNSILLDRIDLKKPVYFLNFYIRVMIFAAVDSLNLLVVLLCSDTFLFLKKHKLGLITYGYDLSKRIVSEVYT